CSGDNINQGNAISIFPLGSSIVVVVVVTVVVVIVVAVVVVVVIVVVVVVVVVIVVGNCRPAPTVPGQMANLLAVIEPWCTRTVMVVVALGT
ncbi:hypothetical protein Tco_1148788, partial [Tanacetum coccineum]